MNTTCPNCSSAAAVGSEVASVCAECVSVSVAGVSFSAPMVFTGVVAVGVAMMAFDLLRRRLNTSTLSRRPTLA